MVVVNGQGGVSLYIHDQAYLSSDSGPITLRERVGRPDLTRFIVRAIMCTRKTGKECSCCDFRNSTPITGACDESVVPLEAEIDAAPSVYEIQR